MSLQRQLASGEVVFLTLSFYQAEGRWQGRCLELEATADGHSLKQAHAELVEMVELHLSALEDAGEQGRFFVENHIVVYPAGAAPIEVAPQAASDQRRYVHACRFTV